jgi:hypothetical protein
VKVDLHKAMSMRIFERRELFIDTYMRNLSLVWVENNWDETYGGVCCGLYANCIRSVDTQSIMPSLKPLVVSSRWSLYFEISL